MGQPDPKFSDMFSTTLVGLPFYGRQVVVDELLNEVEVRGKFPNDFGVWLVNAVDPRFREDRLSGNPPVPRFLDSHFRGNDGFRGDDALRRYARFLAQASVKRLLLQLQELREKRRALDPFGKR